MKTTTTTTIAKTVATPNGIDVTFETCTKKHGREVDVTDVRLVTVGLNPTIDGDGLFIRFSGLGDRRIYTCNQTANHVEIHYVEDYPS